MTTNGNDAAFARPISDDETTSGRVPGDVANWYDDQTGLTKREYFAACALRGLVALQDRGGAPTQWEKDKYEAYGSPDTPRDLWILGYRAWGIADGLIASSGAQE